VGIQVLQDGRLGFEEVGQFSGRVVRGLLEAAEALFEASRIGKNSLIAAEFGPGSPPGDPENHGAEEPHLGRAKEEPEGKAAELGVHGGSRRRMGGIYPERYG
jgi:hypothetical protein